MAESMPLDLPDACESRRRQILKLARWSEFAAHHLQRDPPSLAALCAAELDAPRDLPAYRRRLADLLAPVRDMDALQRTLRRFRNHEMTRIIWRDLNGLADVQVIMRELSDLAECCVAHALDWLYPRACARFGTPRNAAGEAQHLLVLAMGKLGAWELNLSSDIDLIFVFPESGNTDAARPIANQDFFTRLARDLVKALSPRTADGFVFRVDTRLRPFGESGPLVSGFAAFEAYYEGQARTWERYAMIKARVIAGPEAPARELMAILRPFVYRGYVDFGVIDALRTMKRLIQHELEKQGADANIKLGWGGIREIEFIGQAFQLIHGGRDSRLRVRPILEVLARLGELDMLPAYAVDELRQAYRFLRRMENRIQAWRDEQTHLIPADAAGRQRLAESMGFVDWPDCERDLNAHRRRVQGFFEQAFDSPQLDGEDAAQADAEPDTLIDHWLEASGADPAWRADLRELLGSASVRAQDAHGQRRLNRLLPLLLGAARSQHVGRAVFHRLLVFVQRIARRPNYLELLIENPLATSQLVQLFAASPWVAEQLTRHPVLLDELLDPRRLYAPLTREDLRAELDALLGHIDTNDLEQQMERLRQFARGNRLRVAAADIAGVIPLVTVSDYLTAIAEVVIESALDIALAEMRRRHGSPRSIEGSDSGFVVVAYGKLGGRELGYGSDLDLVFVHGGVDPNAMTDGRRPVANEVFYIRLGQRLVHIITTRTHSGRLYEVDMRLRPNGASGLLAASFAAFARYQREDAWTWEHQALVRARAVAGDAALTRRFERLRAELLSRPRDAATLRRDVVEMREKMREALDTSKQQVFDLKQGRGGIADIEFMVQYAVLRWASEHPDLTTDSSNIGLLDKLAALGLLEGDAAARLAAIYQKMRALSHRKALAGEKALIGAAELADERAAVVDIWRRLMRVN